MTPARLEEVERQLEAEDITQMKSWLRAMELLAEVKRLRGLPTTEQPPPTEGSGPEVWGAVLERHNLAGGPLWEDMVARDMLGRERYGTPLRVWNGRDAVSDAYQEALDLIVYLEQVRLRAIAAGHPNVDPETLERASVMVIEIADTLKELHASGNVPVEEPTP